MISESQSQPNHVASSNIPSARPQQPSNIVPTTSIQSLPTQSKVMAPNTVVSMTATSTSTTSVDASRASTTTSASNQSRPMNSPITGNGSGASSLPVVDWSSPEQYLQSLGITVTDENMKRAIQSVFTGKMSSIFDSVLTIFIENKS